MKPIALPIALACVALIALRTAAAAPDVAPDADRARATAAAALPESPAASFERMLAPRTPSAARVSGAPADALTHAFNVALWSAPSVRQAAAPESPAAAFERMLAPRTPAHAPAVTGAPADALTRAFNETLWSAPPTRQASAQVHHTGSAQ